MKPQLLTLVIISLQLNSIAQNTWQAKASLPVSGIFGATSFSIGTKGYIVTGDENGTGSLKLWEWDQPTNTWTTKKNFPGASRIHAVGFSIGNKGYVGTGMGFATGGSLKDFWEYDQLTDTWTQRADFPGTARYFAVGFSASGKGYIGTGWDFSMALKNDFWEYDPASNTWMPKANFPLICYAASAFTIGNKGYVCTGFDGVTLPFSNDFYEFDPASNTWTAKASLPSSGGLAGSGRDMAFSFSIGNKGYIGAGNYVNPAVGFLPLYCQDFWEYDALSDTWTQRPNFPGGDRQWTIGFGIGNSGYAGTGEFTLNYFNDFWEYGPMPTQVEEIAVAPDFLIYANQAENNLAINFKKSGDRHIEAYNMLGEMIYRTRSNENSVHINTFSWSRGLYTIKASLLNIQVSKKIMLQ